MTELPQLDYTWEVPTDHTARLTLDGGLVFANAEELQNAVTTRLATHPELRELHIDCTDLEICDARGLAALITFRRRTDELGITMRLLNRPSVLDRLLERTGTEEYLLGGSEPTAQLDSDSSR